MAAPILQSFCHYVCVGYVCLYVCGYVKQDKRKTPDRNDLKLGTIIVVDTLLKPVDFGLKRSRVGVRISIRKESALISISRECTFLFSFFILVCTIVLCDSELPTQTQ